MSTGKYLISVVLITASLLALGGVLWSRDSGSLKPDSATLAAYRRGDSNAAVTVDVYPDFTCGTCVGEDRAAGNVLRLYPKGVKMVYHPYPSSNVGLIVAEGLEAAGEQGKFWEMHDRLLDIDFAEMAEADIRTQLNAAAGQIGLDLNRFQASSVSDAVKNRVETAKQQAVSRGVGHPSIYVNGKEVFFDQGTDLQTIIDKELKRLGET